MNALKQIDKIDNQFEKSISEDEGNLTPARVSVMQSEVQRSHTHSKRSSEPDQDKELYVKQSSGR